MIGCVVVGGETRCVTGYKRKLYTVLLNVSTIDGEQHKILQAIAINRRERLRWPPAHVPFQALIALAAALGPALETLVGVCDCVYHTCMCDAVSDQHIYNGIVQQQAVRGSRCVTHPTQCVPSRLPWHTTAQTRPCAQAQAHRV